jgi:hypothetical protein
MIDRDHALPLARQAAHRRTSPALSVRRQPNAARSAPAGRRGHRETACRDADEANEARGDLPPSEHVETCDGHKVYPYLLRKLAVTRPNKVWATDITYVPMPRGFIYLAAIVDWFTRRVLVWGCRSQWMPRSVWKRWRKRWHGTASLPFSIRIRARDSPVRPSPPSCTRRDRRKHGWNGLLGRQRVR